MCVCAYLCVSVSAQSRCIMTKSYVLPFSPGDSHTFAKIEREEEEEEDGCWGRKRGGWGEAMGEDEEAKVAWKQSVDAAALRYNWFVEGSWPAAASCFHP